MVAEEPPCPIIRDHRELKYYKEGAANVIFEYVGSDPLLLRRLVRLRLRLITSPSTMTIHRFTEGTLRSLLGEFIMQTIPARLAPLVVHHLNERLVHESRTRNTITLLEEHEDYALIMENLSDAVEFKPKWLVQSLSAPPDWTTCRTCALALLRNKPQAFCPLRLVEPEAEASLRKVCKAPWFSETVLASGVLNLLAFLQNELDNTGPLNAVTNDQNFLIAMTLRDCSLYVVPGRVYIGDLDLKGWDGGKGVYWRDTEKALIEGGYYHAGGCREGEEMDKEENRQT